MTKSHNDFITEENFTRLMTFVPSNPKDDSPGDSEKDAGAEFLMGMYYETEDNSSDEKPAYKKMKTNITQKNSLIEKSMVMNSVLPSAITELSNDS